MRHLVGLLSLLLVLGGCGFGSADLATMAPADAVTTTPADAMAESSSEQRTERSERSGGYDLVSAQDRSRLGWIGMVGGQQRRGELTQIVGGLYLNRGALDGASGDGATADGAALDGARGVISANLRYIETGDPLWDQQIAESFFEVLTAGKEKVHIRVNELRLEPGLPRDAARRGEVLVDIMFARGSTSQRLKVDVIVSPDGWLVRSVGQNTLDLGALGYADRLLSLASDLGLGTIDATLRFEFDLYLESMRADLALPAGPLLKISGASPANATADVAVASRAAFPPAASSGTQAPDLAAPDSGAWPDSGCSPGMVRMVGGEFVLGEADAGLVAAYAPDRILPKARFTLADYCVGLHPFPGKPGLPWPRDGLSVDELPKVEALLARHGRRLCTAPELTLAAAGAANRRYPWHASERRQAACEQDDVRPSSLGSRPQCRSEAGLWDLQVRSSWIRMDKATRSVLTRPTDETSPGHDSAYWLWGANARDDTYYAPTNFGLHHHLAGAKAYQDDALRVCADPGEVSAGQQRLWQALIERYLNDASFEVLRARASGSP